jgi:hypothetical protein
VVLEENRGDKVINEQVPQPIDEQRTLLNNILHRKANWKKKLPSS